MKIEKGLWRTRDGSKAEVVGQCTNGYWLGWNGAEECSWYASGTGNCTKDLIAPWTEEPAEPQEQDEWLYFPIKTDEVCACAHTGAEYQKLKNDIPGCNHWLRIKAEKVQL